MDDKFFFQSTNQAFRIENQIYLNFRLDIFRVRVIVGVVVNTFCE